MNFFEKIGNFVVNQRKQALPLPAQETVKPLENKTEKQTREPTKKVNVMDDAILVMSSKISTLPVIGVLSSYSGVIIRNFYCINEKTLECYVNRGYILGDSLFLPCFGKIYNKEKIFGDSPIYADELNLLFYKRDGNKYTLSRGAFVFADSAITEIEKVDSAKMCDRVAERILYGGLERWRIQTDPVVFLTLITSVVCIVILMWLVLTTIPSVISAASTIGHTLANQTIIQNMTTSPIVVSTVH